VKLACLVYYF